MKKIKVHYWKTTGINGQEIDVSLLELIKTILNSQDPKNSPRGLDQFRMYNRISNAFDKSKKGNILYLEEGDYGHIKSLFDKNLPANWGLDKNIEIAISGFVNCEDA